MIEGCSTGGTDTSTWIERPLSGQNPFGDKAPALPKGETWSAYGPFLKEPLVSSPPAIAINPVNGEVTYFVDDFTVTGTLPDGNLIGEDGLVTWIWQGSRWKLANLWLGPGSSAQSQPSATAHPSPSEGRTFHTFEVGTYATSPDPPLGGIVLWMRYLSATSHCISSSPGCTHYSSISGGWKSGTWIWRDNHWNKLAGVNSPLSGISHASGSIFGSGVSIAYDGATHTVVLYLGEVMSPIDTTSTTWLFDGSAWKEIHPAKSPAARVGVSMAYDPATRQLILFGGAASLSHLATDYNTTWVWTGSTWRKLHPTKSPPAYVGASMVYDPATRQLLLFGGAINLGHLAGESNATWVWSGTTWKEMHPAKSPAARVEAPMAYDPATRQLLLFGGLSIEHGRANSNSALRLGRQVWIWQNH